MLKMKVSYSEQNGYSIKESKNSTFLPLRQSEIFYKGEHIGIFGIVHPDVLKNHEWPYPTSMMEINIEKLIKKIYL